MEQLNFQLDLTIAEQKKMQMRYHFKEEDLDDLCSFWRALKPIIHAKAYYKVFLEKESLPDELSFIQELPAVIAVVTLGKGPDELQEVYLKDEQVLSAYMIECLSMAVLEKAYEQFSAELHKKIGLSIYSYEFLGERYSLEKIKDIFGCLDQNEVTYNEALMLIPQKSVVFIGALCKESSRNVHLCEKCEQTDCPNREIPVVLPYGKSLILQKMRANNISEDTKWKRD